jgi:hypothetical protein
MSDLTPPGFTITTLMLKGASSIRRASENLVSAAFVALYVAERCSNFSSHAAYHWQSFQIYSPNESYFKKKEKKRKKKKKKKKERTKIY